MYTYIYTHTYMLSINMYIYTCTASMLLPALPSTPRLMALSMLSFGMLLALVTMMMGECHQYKTHTHTSILHRIRRGRDPHHTSAYIIYIYIHTHLYRHTQTHKPWLWRWPPPDEFLLRPPSLGGPPPSAPPSAFVCGAGEEESGMGMSAACTFSNL